MEFAIQLFRYPGAELFPEGRFESTVVDVTEVDAKLADGWFRTTAQAKGAHDKAQAE